MSLVLDEHRQYLEDDVRVSAFRDALNEVVRAGDVVLDLGSGTGIQSLLACRAGARRVYAVDSGEILSVARDIVAANGFADRVTFIRALSTRVSLPEPVDVVTGDQIGRFGFEAGLLDYWIDARQRLLRPGGRLVPESVELWAAPIELPDAWEQAMFWRRQPMGFDFTPAAEIAINTGYPVKAAGHALIGESWRVAALHLASAVEGRIHGTATVRAQRRGVVHGVAGWFAAHLTPHVTMTNAPAAQRRINRSHAFFPLREPIDVLEGDELRLSMQIVPRELLVSWSVRTNRAAAAPRQSTFAGMLLSREDLAKSAPGFVPRLTVWGRARQTVLALCDGRRTLAEIEQGLRETHPALFPTPSEAATFVAEVIHPYAD